MAPVNVCLPCAEATRYNCEKFHDRMLHNRSSYLILLRDPDGFFVELVQRNPAPATKAPAGRQFSST